MKTIGTVHKTVGGHFRAKTAAMEAFGLVDPVDYRRELEQNKPKALARFEVNGDNGGKTFVIYADKIISSGSDETGASYAELNIDGSASVGSYDAETGRWDRGYSSSSPELAKTVAANVLREIDAFPGFMDVLPQSFKNILKQLTAIDSPKFGALGLR